MFDRDRTKPFLIRYALYLYFLGLSLRSTSKALAFIDEKGEPIITPAAYYFDSVQTGRASYISF